MTVPALLTRYSQDVAGDNRGLARYIGSLEGGRSKVSVNSSLSVGDRSDFFRFRVTDEGFARIRTGELVGNAQNEGTELAKDGSVRYRLMTQSGRVLADSDPDSATFDEWQKLNSSDNLRVGKGSFTLQVSRGKDAIDSKAYIYSFTLRSNVDPVTDDSPETATREFLTTETPAAAGSQFDLYGNVTAVLGMFTDVRVI